MKTLSVAQTQMVEIAKAISYNSQLIIMDEPTSAITEREVDHLHRMMRSLRESGVRSSTSPTRWTRCSGSPTR